VSGIADVTWSEGFASSVFVAGERLMNHLRGMERKRERKKAKKNKKRIASAFVGEIFRKYLSYE